MTCYQRLSRAWGIFFLLLLLQTGQESRSQTALPREYQLKAVWLYNFLKFVDWPADAFPPSGGSFIIGVLGTNPFGELLFELTERSAQGRKIIVKQLDGLADYRDCHMIFISASEKDRLPQILETLKRTNILSVSEIQGFAEGGGMINLVVERNKVRVEINHSAAVRSGLIIGSQLLKYARIVES